MPRASSLGMRFLAHVSVLLVIGSSNAQISKIQKPPDVLVFNARWWNQAYNDEQQGFIYGYLDCRPWPKAAKASVDDYQNAVTKALGTGKGNDARDVAKAIQQAAATLKSRDIRGGENYTERHGFLDGEWWGEDGRQPWPSGLADADRGYVEGYLECAAIPATARAVSRYQTAINRHYARGRHSHDKIANVLQPLLSHPVSSQP